MLKSSFTFQQILDNDARILHTEIPKIKFLQCSVECRV